MPAAHFGAGLAFDADYVCRVVERSSHEGRSDSVAVDWDARSLEVADLVDREPPGHDDLHGLEAFGIERIAMIRYGISDIRLFYENDLRFLDQF